MTLHLNIWIVKYRKKMTFFLYKSTRKLYDTGVIRSNLYFYSCCQDVTIFVVQTYE
jgi:hypothetical protein